MSKDYDRHVRHAVEQYVNGLGYRARVMDAASLADEATAYAQDYAAEASRPAAPTWRPRSSRNAGRPPPRPATRPVLTH
jgi:hypothetical protein